MRGSYLARLRSAFVVMFLAVFKRRSGRKESPSDTIQEERKSGRSAFKEELATTLRNVCILLQHEVEIQVECRKNSQMVY